MTLATLDTRGRAKVGGFCAESGTKHLISEGTDVTSIKPLGLGRARPINLSGRILGEAVNRRVRIVLALRAAAPAYLARDN